MSRLLQLATLAGIVLAVGGVAGLLVQGRRTNHHLEDIMADTSRLTQDVESLKSEVAAAADRVSAALATLTDDSADQAAVDAAATEIESAVAGLHAIAQQPDAGPTTEPTTGPDAGPDAGPTGV